MSQSHAACSPQRPLRILVCVSGMSPAIITETLYRLITQPEPFVPDEIHVITTRAGADKVREKLLLPQPNSHVCGALYQLLADYPQHFGAIRPRLDDSTIHIITPKDKLSEGLEDIVTLEDNHAAAQTIYRVMHELKAKRGAQIHASVAGGRKSMSFYIGQAFSLLADDGDVLSHVLVNEPFDVPDFFYIPPQPQVLRYIDRQSGQTRECHTVDARIELAEMSVLKLGPVLRDALPHSALSDFDTAVQLAQGLLRPPPARLRIHEGQGQLLFCGQTVEMTGVPFMLLALFALARRELKAPIVLNYTRQGWVQLAEEFKHLGLGSRLDGGAPDFGPGISRIHTDLKPCLGGSLAKLFKVNPVRRRSAGARALGPRAPIIELEGFSTALLKQMRMALQHMAAAAVMNQASSEESQT